MKRADPPRFKPVVLLLVQIHRTKFCHTTIKKDISGLQNSATSPVSLNYSFGYPHTTELCYHFCIYCAIPFFSYFILQNSIVSHFIIFIIITVKGGKHERLQLTSPKPNPFVLCKSLLISHTISRLKQ